MSFSIKPLSAALGAEIEGFDVSTLEAGRDFDWIFSALKQYQVLCFRGQQIGQEHFESFAALFGDVNDYYLPDGAQTRKLYVLDYKEQIKGHNSGWHTDGLYYGNQMKFTLLNVTKVPEKGGDTLWSGLYAAYEGLSEKMRDFLKGLTISYDFHSLFNDENDPSGKFRKIYRENGQGSIKVPIIDHSEMTGKPFLFFYPGCRSTVQGVSEVESKLITDFLALYIERQEFVYRHRWRKGDLVIWDNRSTLHRVVPDFVGDRVLHRLTVM